MFSVFGWTPSLRCMLRTRVLACGCSVGVYETWSGRIVQIIDAHGSGCALADHTVDSIVVLHEDRSASPSHAPRA
jgi:hypothetical protein